VGTFLTHSVHVNDYGMETVYGMEMV